MHVQFAFYRDFIEIMSWLSHPFLLSQADFTEKM